MLRPDITPSIARFVAKNFRNAEEPIRLCYTGNTFINRSEYQGKPKEITQIGAELINDASDAADAEMLALTVECLLAAGLKEFQVEVGHVGFFRAVAEEAGIGSEDLGELMQLINDKNTFGVADFLRRFNIPDKQKDLFAMLPNMFGPAGRLKEFKSMTGNPGACAAIDHLERIYELMKLYGYDKYVSFDLGMLSKYGYYTGIIINAYTYGTGDTLISGGRYDKLVGQFGKDAPAIGMAVFVDRLLSAVLRQGIEIPSGEQVRNVALREGVSKALEEVIALRRAGKPARPV